MKVCDVIDLAIGSELKNLNVKDDRRVVLGYYNLGVLEIHKRFTLNQQKATVNMVAGVNKYSFKESDLNVEIDLSDNVYLKIDELRDKEDNLLALNNEVNGKGIQTLSFDTIDIPDEVLDPGFSLNVLYRASPKFAVHEEAEVSLPQQFLEALLHYMAYKGHGIIVGNDQQDNNTYFRRFLGSCKQISKNGLFNQNELESSKFVDRGFP